jgi:hypothetical protein
MGSALKNFFSPVHPVVENDHTVSVGKRRLEDVVLRILAADISCRSEGMFLVNKSTVQTAIKKAEMIIEEIDKEYENLVEK